MKEIFLTQRRRDAKTQSLFIDLFKNLSTSAPLRLCVLFLFFAIAAFAQNDGSEQNVTGKAGTFAIVNARIVTVSGATIENGTILIQDGKIAAVGANVSV